MRRIEEQKGQTIAITMMVTLLMLLLSATVVTSVIQNMRDAAESKNQATLYSAAEVGLGMAQRDINRSAYFMLGLAWSRFFSSDNPEGTLNQFFSPAKNGTPYKFFEYFKDLRNWPGFTVQDGWVKLNPGSETADNSYHFPRTDAYADQIIGENAADDSLSKKQHFITRSWKKGVDYASADSAANRTQRYRYYVKRPNGVATPSCYGWYNDLLPLDYGTAGDGTAAGAYQSLVYKKLYTFRNDGGSPPIRVAVYIRMNLEDYVSTKTTDGNKGNPLCDCGAGGTRYHTETANTSLDNYISHCPRNSVKFLIAAVSESTLDADSQFSQCNMTVELGGAVRIQELPFNKLPNGSISGLANMVISDLGYLYDPGCFAPVLSPLVAADPGGMVGCKGATVSGMVFPAGATTDLMATNPVHWWERGRVFLYAQPLVDDPGGRWKKDTVFFVGFSPNSDKYMFWYLYGTPPKAGADASFPAFMGYNKASDTLNDIAGVINDNTDLKKDFDNAVDVASIPEPKSILKGGLKAEDIENLDSSSGKWVLSHASGYYGPSGRFFIQRRKNPAVDANYVGFTPQATGFAYFASAHYLATGLLLPYRIGLLVASISTDVIRGFY